LTAIHHDHIILILVIELIASRSPSRPDEHIPRADLVATATADAGVRIHGTNELRFHGLPPRVSLWMVIDIMISLVCTGTSFALKYVWV
jgi:hypothetical protein